jgi:hypothetical protein
VVGGYRADAIDQAGISLVVNERYAETDELASLACAVDRLESDTLRWRGPRAARIISIWAVSRGCRMSEVRRSRLPSTLMRYRRKNRRWFACLPAAYGHLLHSAA